MNEFGFCHRDRREITASAIGESESGGVVVGVNDAVLEVWDFAP